jgi:hypothetical protein
MRKLKYTTELNRYYIGETTSGATNDIYITDGTTTLKLEDCLIWESSEFKVRDFDATVKQCKTNAEEMREMGWTIV